MKSSLSGSVKALSKTENDARSNTETITASSIARVKTYAPPRQPYLAIHDGRIGMQVIWPPLRRARPRSRPRIVITGAAFRDVSPAGENLRLAIDELRRLRAARERRGLQVSQRAFEAAERFLRDHLRDDRVFPLDIMTLDDGGVLLEWTLGQIKVQLQFCADGTLEVGAYDGDGNDLEMPLDGFLDPYAASLYRELL